MDLASFNDLALPNKTALGDDVADWLRRAIVEGHIEPGVRLREEQLAELLKVSRGPVREALLQLEREGLVLRRRNRGAVVARLSRRDVEEVYSLRFALERLALRWAARQASAAELSAMEEEIGKQRVALTRDVSRQRAAELDLEFHDLVYQAARNERLWRFWSELRPQVYIFLLSRDYVGTPEFGDIVVNNHLAFVDVIRARDEVHAEEVAEDHVRQSYERVIRSYGSNVDSDAQIPSSDGEPLPSRYLIP
jgi:DNA-binding GntR family transcriptional regulator